ncbi:MAG: hypothetical protein N2Z72_03910 [Bacteroidales bacterium]|nr:hypothetical protein [Bacteroidales bacterium]
MKKILLVNVLFVFALAGLFSQSKYFREEVHFPYKKVPIVGQNGRHYFAAMYGFQVAITTHKTLLAPTSPLGTLEPTLGYIYKLRITSWFSTGLTSNYAIYGYIYLNDSMKIFPDVFSHRRQSIRTGLLEGNFYIRLNFDPKRGNTLGKYVDFFIWGGYPIMRRQYYKDHISKEIYSVKVKNYQGIANDWQYGYGIRLGFKSFFAYLKYRASNLLSSEFSNKLEPPRWALGIVYQLSLPSKSKNS